MSVTTNEKPCWVCGKLTTSVCGACASADKPMEISFCSRECQKMVWPIDKMFCGPGKTNPFILPPLSKEEADEAWKNRHEGYFYANHKGPFSLMGRLASNNLGQGTFPIILRAPRDSEFPHAALPEYQHHLARIRHSEAGRTPGDIGKPNSPSAMMVAVQQISSSYLFDIGDRTERNLVAFSPSGPLASALHRLSLLHYLIAKLDSNAGWLKASGTKLADALDYTSTMVEAETRRAGSPLKDSQIATLARMCRSKLRAVAYMAESAQGVG
ncbi:hypothetical protein JCM8547_003099 [Rhodosporidiobolus lusitaniae]